MKDDTIIKNLLQQYGIEEPSSTFNNNVMQRINAEVFAKQSKPLLSAFILNILKVTFVIVVVAIVVFVVSDPASFSINVSNIYRQLFSFIIVFWIGMLMNLGLNKKWGSKNAFFL
jgi:hypothetical protein